MSIGPLGMIGSMAGTPLSQSRGSSVDQAQQQNADQARQTQSEGRAETAAGIGQTEQDEQAGERDADGRRLWEEPAGASKQPDEEVPAEPQHGSRDASGTRGTRLDLEG